MVIGVNCLAIDSEYVGGITTYALGLIRGMVKSRSNETFILYVTRENKKVFQEFENQPYIQFKVLEFPNSLWIKIFRNVLSLAAPTFIYKFFIDIIYSHISKTIDYEVDCVYFPTTLIFPFNYKKPTIVSMHDIQHVHFPEFFTHKERVFRKHNFQLTADHATFIQASSSFIKEDLKNHFPDLDPKNIWVIPEGVDIDTFKIKIPTDYLFEKYPIDNEFIFFPAQLWKHKNHLNVLKAIKEIEKETGKKICLVLTGAKYSAADEIFDFVAKNKMDYVHYLGKVPYQDLIALYQASKIFITAVLYESSSLPLREAAAAGTALIASKIGPNVEAAEILDVELFDVGETTNLKKSILELWTDSQKREKQIQHNNTAIYEYAWEKVGEAYLKAIKNDVR